jgi:hypothetical protein
MWIEPYDELDAEVDGTGYHVDEFIEMVSRVS